MSRNEGYRLLHFSSLPPPLPSDCPVGIRDFAASNRGFPDALHRALRARVPPEVPVERAWHAKQHASHSVEAGREFVGAYVPYVHYVERLSLDAAMTGGHHGAEHEKQAAPVEHKHQ